MIGSFVDWLAGNFPGLRVYDHGAVCTLALPNGYFATIDPAGRGVGELRADVRGRIRLAAGMPRKPSGRIA